MIATDHAPHSEEEKSKGLKGSLMGIVGLETCFPVLYTNLVKTGVITLQKLIELLCVNPRKRFGIKEQGFTVWNLDESYNIESSKDGKDQENSGYLYTINIKLENDKINKNLKVFHVLEDFTYVLYSYALVPLVKLL